MYISRQAVGARRNYKQKIPKTSKNNAVTWYLCGIAWLRQKISLEPKSAPSETALSFLNPSTKMGSSFEYSLAQNKLSRFLKSISNRIMSSQGKYVFH